MRGIRTWWQAPITAVPRAPWWYRALVGAVAVVVAIVLAVWR